MAVSGVKVRVRVDDKDLRAALARLQKKGGDSAIQTALKSIGELLLNSTRERMDRQVDPAGRPWAPLNPIYKFGWFVRKLNGKGSSRRGIKKGPLILQESGQLFASLRYQVGNGQLQVGTNKIYAALMQFGGTVVPRKAPMLTFWFGGKLVQMQKVTIPARAYLGMSAEDRARALEAIQDVYELAWGGT